MENEKTNTELVTIATVNQLATATIVQTVLEEAGIMVFLQDVNMSQLYWNVTGGIRIQVSETDVEQAYQLLVENGYEYLFKQL